jgi:hypothetical protein
MSTLPRLRGETLALAAFFVVVAAFYAWTAATSDAFRFDQSGTGTGRYGWLADSLLHGQLHLRMHVPQGLIDLPNPYDPTANRQYRIPQGMQDLTLWEGKFYLYWGIVPELLFVPFRALGIWMSSSLVAAVLYFGGFTFSVLTLRFVVRKFVPTTPSWALWVGMAVLAFGNVAPFTLRRPEHSEIAIGGGLCFGFMAIWLLLTGLLGPTVSLRRVALASLAAGLAIGSRPTWIVLAVVPVILAIVAWRSARWPRGRGPARYLLALLGPIGVCAVLLMAYNMARFGSPFELGARYQLAGFDQQGYAPFDARFLGPGLFYYLLEPLTPEALFPFVTMGPAPYYPWSLPSGYQQSEPTSGLLPMVPIVLVLALLPFRARGWDRTLRTIVLGFLALAVGVLVLVCGAVWSTTQRYAVDFTALFLMAALLTWFTTLTPDRPPRRRRLSLALGLSAAVWTIVMGLAISFLGYGSPMERKHPALLANLESAFSPVSRVMAALNGRPVIGRIVAPRGESRDTRASWSSLGRDDISIFAGSRPVLLRVASPRDEMRTLTALVAQGPDAPAGAPVSITLATGRGSPVVLPPAVLPPSNQAQPIAVPISIRGGVSSISVTAQAAGATAQAAGRKLAVLGQLNLEEPVR